MRIFLDSSSYAKYFILEKGSEDVEKILSGASELGLSIICIPEILSALNRRLREMNITKQQYEVIKNQLYDEVTDIELVQLSDSVISFSIYLLEKHLLRAMDAIHIACAIEWKPDLFISSDIRQIDAAKFHIKKTQFI